MDIIYPALSWMETMKEFKSIYEPVFDVEETICCQECGKELCEEDAIPSERWEDQFLCGSKECLEKHYYGWAEKIYF